MLGGVKVLVPLVFSAMVVLSSGCVTDPTTFAKTIPLVQEFLNDHPNAEIKVVHYTETESADMLDYIKEDCGKLSVEPKEYYFINITDPSTDLVIRAWIDWENQIVECVYKEGSIVDPSNCTSLYRARCFGDHVYWFDSCGNREKKKEYCPLGCSNGECISAGDICDVERSYTEKPPCVCPDGYEMLVLYPSCLEPVTGLITGMPFAVTTDVAEKAVTTESGEVEISSDFTTDFVNRCPDTKPVYRCVRRQQCKSHAQVKCYKGHVYWFDSCGHVQEKKEYCSDDCYNGFCKGVRTCEQMGGYCTYSNIACTEEAKQCPDGTWVGRTGPNCEFAPCPIYTDSATGMVHDTDTSVTDTSIGCYDSDGGKNYNQKGYAKYGDTRYEDHCNSDGTLTEKYCSNGELAAVKVTCENGRCSDGACVYDDAPSSSSGGGGIAYPVCRDGYIRANYWCPGSGVCCIPERAQCTDSDGGKDFYEKGKTCIGGNYVEEETVTAYCEVDRCLRATCVGCPDRLIEYYCEEGDISEWGEINHVYTDCRYGCEDGACLKEEEFCGWSTYYECDSDSDCAPGGCSSQVCGGINESIITECMYRDCYNAGNYGLSCVCYDDNKCQWSEKERCAEEGELTSGAVSPDYYYGCCEGLESFDPWPPNWAGGGMLCYDPDKGVPVCDGEGTDDEGWYYPNEELLAEWDCSNEILECTDSDGGKNYYVKGITEKGSTTNSDACLDFDDITLEKYSGAYVREYYCDENDDIIGEPYECPNGCEDGACVTCMDADGEDYYTSSHIKDYVNGNWITTFDTCKSSTEVEERICVSGHGANKYFICPNGCEDGACIEQTGTCIDSDGEEDDFYENRTVVVDLEGEGILTVSDSCLYLLEDLAVQYDFYENLLNSMINYGVIDESQLGNDNILIESYCPDGVELNISSPFMFQHTYACPNGCLEGKCEIEA